MSIQLLRENIRSIARKVKKEQKYSLKEEYTLRKYIRKLLKEIEEVSPHDSTGINVLEDLLKTIIPIVSTGYKRLTTDVEQRQSFRAHIIRAVQNLLSTESIYFNAGASAKNANQLNEQDEEIEQDVSAAEQDPAFIDIEKEKKQKQQKDAQPKPEDAFEELPDQDPTGRGFALRTFDKIQNQILDSYSLLGKNEDREVFYDYLITNLKLYFDRFEDELQKNLEEPTTDAYEQEKKKKADSLTAGGFTQDEVDVADQTAALEEPTEEEPAV